MTTTSCSTTRVWAHRGASAHAPENTLEAFDLAHAQGADGAELDVQRSADGHLVVIHDETVDRTTDGTGRVVDLELADLVRLDASRGHDAHRGADGASWHGGPVRVPTLAAVLDLLAPTGMTVNIELKNSVAPYPGMESEVLAAAGAAGLRDRILCSSFNHRSIARLRELDPGVALGILYSQQLVRPWESGAAFGATAIHPGHWLLGTEDLAAARQAGLATNVWTINRGDQLDAWYAAGVDAVITDVPDLAVDRRAARAA